MYTELIHDSDGGGDAWGDIGDPCVSLSRCVFLSMYMCLYLRCMRQRLRRTLYTYPRAFASPALPVHSGYFLVLSLSLRLQPDSRLFFCACVRVCLSRRSFVWFLRLSVRPRCVCMRMCHDDFEWASFLFFCSLPPPLVSLLALQLKAPTAHARTLPMAFLSSARKKKYQTNTSRRGRRGGWRENASETQEEKEVVEKAHMYSDAHGAIRSHVCSLIIEHEIDLKSGSKQKEATGAGSPLSCSPVAPPPLWFSFSRLPPPPFLAPAPLPVPVCL